MNTLFNLIVVVQVLSALIIIGLVLMQHGKGADMGAAFGSGASGSLFGATGSSNFMSKSTGVAAAVFFASTLALAYFGTQRGPIAGAGVMERVAPAKPVTGSGAIPATTTAAPAPVAPVTGSAAVPATAPVAPAVVPAAPGGAVPK
ncbi:preprotein translocase subunit SecG [Massilia sp. DWR3-1-1]|uniref:preprotein translocase subunit SecG n=1 Tax=Massilia sp. DWR3-1-1 TaxID=2804559 RepID=UPI003CED5B24